MPSAIAIELVGLQDAKGDTTTETTERIDLSGPISAICELVGMEKDDVYRIDLRPRTADVHYFERDGEGHKYLRNGRPATNVKSVPIKT